MTRPRPLVVSLLGTRPEAIKLAPFHTALGALGTVSSQLWTTTQQGPVVDEALADLGVAADRVLAFDRVDGSLTELAQLSLACLGPALREAAPAAVVVQGDTLTALMGALAAFWSGIPVVHLEAGLRTGVLASPFPEEGNRRLIADIASLHLAPTPAAAAALAVEGVHRNVHVVGNTVVDALAIVAAARAPLPAYVESFLATRHRVAVVTAHRRESWGAPIGRIADAVAHLARLHPDVAFVFATHPNPTVRAVVADRLADAAGVLVVDPLPYAQFVHLLSRAAVVLSDSGGVQEEAPSLGVPAVVLREDTERREGLDAGVAALAGTDEFTILSLANAALSHTRLGLAGNPYGDGRAAARSAALVAQLLGVGDALPDWVPADDGPRWFARDTAGQAVRAGRQLEVVA